MKKSFSIGMFMFLTVMLSAFAASAKTMQLEKVPGLMTGSQAPDFTAKTHMGETITLSELYKEGPVVLIFYRGAWCPYCNLHLQQFQAKASEFEGLSAKVLGVSIDLAEYGNKTVEGNQLSFDVLSDPNAEILKAYNQIFNVPEDLVETYKVKYGINLEEHSGRTDGVISIPATYVIRQDGVIIFAYANTDYKTRTSPEEVLQVLRNVIR